MFPEISCVIKIKTKTCIKKNKDKNSESIHLDFQHIYFGGMIIKNEVSNFQIEVIIPTKRMQ